MNSIDELIERFNAAGVRYLLIGGQAMRLIGMPRFSMDWDFFVPPQDESNFARLNAALEEDLDADLVPLGPRRENFVQTYQTRWGILQFHLGVPGVPEFEVAEAAAVERLTESGTGVKCLSGSHMLASKEAANRPHDQLDIEFLNQLRQAGKLT